MRYFHERRGHEKLLIFFNGWGMDEHPFQALELDACDMLMFYDYRTAELPACCLDIFAKYQQFELFAWSFGVFFASFLRQSLPPTQRAIACAGTLWPLDRTRGIPPRIFERTLRQAERAVAGTFYERMFTHAADYQNYLNHPVTRSVAERVEELHAVSRHLTHPLAEPIASDIIASNDVRTAPWSDYDVAMIPNADKIFPPENQMRSWECVQGKYPSLEIVKLPNVGHFPFDQFLCWSELMNISTPEHFRSRSDS